MDEQDVDVALGVPVVAGSGAEYARVQRLGVPGCEVRAEALPQLEAEAGQQVRDRRGEVVPVKFVDPVAAHLRGSDDALLDKAREAAPYPDL
jgi:hypothetical protein